MVKPYPTRAVAFRPQRFISAATGVESTRNHKKTMVGRKLTAPCCPAGNSSPIRPVIGATRSQNPMMKKPASTGPSSFPPLSVRFIRCRLRIPIFQSYVFFRKKRSPGEDYFAQHSSRNENCGTRSPHNNHPELAHPMSESPRKKRPDPGSGPAKCKKTVAIACL